MPVTILDSGGGEGESVEARVGSSVPYTILPSALLTRLGWEKRFTQIFRLPNGQRVGLDMAEVRMRLEGRERFITCIVGADDDVVIIGRTALSAFGLRFDSDHAGHELVHEIASL